MVILLRRALAAAALSLLLPSFSHAQVLPDATVRLTLPQAASFASAFTELSRQAHVMVVAEDQPLHLALTPQAAAGLTLNKDGEPLSALLPRLAAAYDYNVVPFGKAFLLEKRYTDPADFPSVTVKECALGLEEADHCAENFNPHFSDAAVVGSPVMKDLVYSLTPEQLAAIRDDKQGLPVASLSPVQQQEVQQFVLLSSVSGFDDLTTMVGSINRIAASDPRFGWQFLPMMNTRLFGFDARYFGHAAFVPLSKPNQVTCDIAYAGMDIHPLPVEGEPLPPVRLTTTWLSSAPDPTDPLPVRANAPKPAPPVSSSLAEIITRLNARIAADPKGDGLKLSVEPYLAPKQATVFGAEAATPRQALAALAEVYGLRVLTEEKEKGHDRLRLTRQTASVPLTLIALHDSLLQALPDPLVRACVLNNHPAPFFNPAAPVSPIPPGLSPPLVYAVRQLRTAMEPKIRASKDGRVALSSLSEREGRAFATLIMLQSMHWLGAWVHKDPPEMITRFNDLRLGGGLYEKDGKKQINLMLQLPDTSNPNALSMIGGGTIDYDPLNHTL